MKGRHWPEFSTLRLAFLRSFLILKPEIPKETARFSTAQNLGIAKKLGRKNICQKLKTAFFKAFFDDKTGISIALTRKRNEIPVLNPGQTQEDEMQNILKKVSGKKEKAASCRTLQGRESVKQPGIIFSGFKSRLSSMELLERLSVEGK